MICHLPWCEGAIVALTQLLDLSVRQAAQKGKVFEE